jgi:tetratricopeptide (TPR) repeat protein
MPTVFLSYSRKDLSRLKKLEAQLKAQPKISIWRDQGKIYGGQKWPKVLGEAIADQDVVLLAWSKHSAASHFVEFEWCTALALKKTIIPCLLDSTTLPPSLAGTQGIPVRDIQGIIAVLIGAVPTEDAGRRAEVVSKLGQIKTTEPKEVLVEARSLFDQRGWVVQGNVIQARTVHMHYHSDSSKPLNGTARERYLKGRVLLVEDNDELTPAAGVNVTLMQTADSVVTGPEGLFKLSLPDSCQSGIKVECSVGKDGWVIFSPFDGEITIPAFDTELVKIRLVKKGSTKLWSAERIEKFIQDMVGKSKEQIRPEGKPQEIDLSRYIQDWAARYGFSHQRVKVEIDKWVAEAEQKYDSYQLGLAAYAKKNFSEAFLHFQVSGQNKVKQLHEATTKVQALTEEAVRDFRLAGDAAYNQYEFDQALTLYQQALQLVSKQDRPRLWAELRDDIGGANLEIGIRAASERIHHHLSESVAAYREALTVYTKDQLPRQWAMTQNNLGSVLNHQGRRTGEEAGIRLLAEAVAAYREALTVYTKDQLPQDWAMIQNNLGSVLDHQGTRTGGEAGTRLLAEAVTAYREALTVRTKDQLPRQWATTHNNLGIVLRHQGTRTGGEAGTRLLAEAVAACREALTVYTKEQFPQQWATTQNNLGIVLRHQGTRTGGEAGTRLLAEAVNVYREALTVRTKEQLPQDWAMTQNNLGTVLREQGTRTGRETGTRLLAEALAAYREALTIVTREHLPGIWVKTRPNMTVTLLFKHDWSGVTSDVAGLGTDPVIDAGTKVALQYLEVIALVGQGERGLIPHKVKTLREGVIAKFQAIPQTWDFESIKFFIKTDDYLAGDRVWLLDLIAAFEQQDRETMLAKLEALQAKFLTPRTP